MLWLALCRPSILDDGPASRQHLFLLIIMLCLSMRDEGRYVAIELRRDTFLWPLWIYICLCLGLRQWLVTESWLFTVLCLVRDGIWAERRLSSNLATTLKIPLSISKFRPFDISPEAQGSKMSRVRPIVLKVVSNWKFCAESENQRLTCRPGKFSK